MCPNLEELHVGNLYSNNILFSQEPVADNFHRFSTLKYLKTLTLSGFEFNALNSEEFLKEVSICCLTCDGGCVMNCFVFPLFSFLGNAATCSVCTWRVNLKAIKADFIKIYASTFRWREICAISGEAKFFEFNLGNLERISRWDGKLKLRK